MGQAMKIQIKDIYRMGDAMVAVFRSVEKTYGPRQGTVDWLRDPDRSARDEEMTDEQRRQLSTRI